MRKPLLQTLQLAIGYRTKRETKHVIDDLSLSLYEGELVCLIGPNGMGKSTLLRTIAGLQEPLSGNILVENKPIGSLSAPQLARKMSVVLSKQQGINLRVRELIEMGRIPHTGWLGKLQERDRLQVEEAIRTTQLQDFTERFFEQLSDGEKQRVMLARALAQDTSIILLDEPTAHLDIPNKVEMMMLLQQLAHQTKKAIVLSTHDLQVALDIADKIWLVSPKGTIEVGWPEELVLSGAFQQAFTKNGFSFDNTTGLFSVVRKNTSIKVHVSGEGVGVIWTKKALERKGFQLTAYEPDFHVDVHQETNNYKWSCVDSAGKRKEFNTLDALVHILSVI
jgi:iron complex transport system ATP-binding protein